ncbi:MAG: phosphatidylserine decarboxylase, partial [Phycisphaerales bacterium]
PPSPPLLFSSSPLLAQLLLTPYGIREWATASIAAIAIGVPSALAGWWPLTAVAALALFGVVWFFRDPPGRRPADSNPLSMVSPADGVVSSVFRDERHEAVGGPAVVVRIFLSVLDVHVNRSPADAEVVRLEHRPGRYLDARTEASATLNESNLIVLKLVDGRPIGVKQISGASARRIVCPREPGAKLARGERFGMIKVGSTTELILPDPDRVETLVKVGDRVVGGVTILARIAPA